ncbi:MAG: cation-translocating P-type ATPase [Bauldia sp.]|nr:cation-translocating P-type ATPase [Bauldia sp.]
MNRGGTPTAGEPAVTAAEPYQRTAAEVQAELGTDGEAGLTAADAARRLAEHGRNELDAEKPVPAWRKFLRQFASVLVLLLLAASLVSAVLWLVERDSALPYEAMAIFAIVVLNAVMGYVQEARAEQAVAALRGLTAARATVMRSGVRETIPAAELVPGDVILIEEGDAIPADARLISVTSLQTAEAALTGESLPVAKEEAAIAGEKPLGDRRNMVFSGTVATYGRGRAVVTGTGMRTEMGRIAGMIEGAAEQATPLQKELARVGRLLGIIVVALALLMIAAILIVEDVSSVSALFDVLILGVALAVAAVPEGLPVVVTVVLSIGVQRMARRNAIIRHLAAVETLGSANVIASDKTGTLTRNEMTVRVLATASGRIDFGGIGYVPEGEVKSAGGPVEGPLRSEMMRALVAADLANNAALREVDGRWTVQGDPTEGALLVAARKAGLTPDALEDRLPRIAEVPFSSERKLMSTVHSDAEHPEGLRALTKGAPDVLLTHCSHELVGDAARPLDAARRAAIMALNDSLAGEGLRTLAVAFRTLDGRDGAASEFDSSVEEELVFLGLVGMIDPPRAEALDAIAEARRAGIRIMMITGDHPMTALAVARELGITDDGRALTGAELAAATEADLDAAVAEVSVYSRVNPEHKLRIVGALQRSGMVVAMTGDGVNDAPALKAADIGVAMGITGTDVSKQAADMVLADDNFASIVAAVEEGRAIFSNIRKFLRYLLSSNIGEVMTMFFGVLFADAIGLIPGAGEGVVLPLMATQILWINLVTDGAPALALGVDPADHRAMGRPPRPHGEPVITRQMWSGIFFVGAIMAVGTLLVLDGALPGGFIEGSGTLGYGQTMAFTTLMLFQLFNVFNARSDRVSAVHGLFANPWLWGAVALSLALHGAVLYVPFLQDAFSTVPLSGADWLLCTAVASSVLILREASKFVLRRLDARREPSAGGGTGRPRPVPL